MPADVISNTATSNAAAESKSARKKKGKADAGPAANAIATQNPDTRSETPSQDAKVNGTDGSSENPYIRELQKNIRNINKKLSSMQKLDAVLAENPGVSIDDLVASRKINNDQKLQAQKKPALQSQLAQLEEQLAQYKKIDQEYQQRLSTEKELLQTSHSAELEKLRETLKAEAAIEQQKVFKQRLLVLSRFLRTAAARRQTEDDDSEETKAFEGALLLVYGGDPSAVAAAEKLIDGADEGVPSTEGTLLNVTYARVKQVALADNPYAAEEAWVDNVAAAEPFPSEAGTDSAAAGSDPTTANAGLTEQADAVQLPNGVAPVDAVQHSQAPAAASTGAEAANAAAESQWDSKAEEQDPLAESFEIVPRDPAETETPAQPAPVTSTQSWADEVPAELASTAPTGDANDGFHEVHHRGGRGRADRGGESRGGYRGRGRGGDGRGRGRGGFRGERGGPRGGGGYRGGRGRGDAAQN